jgi:hypothetical protein
MLFKHILGPKKMPLFSVYSTNGPPSAQNQVKVKQMAYEAIDIRTKQRNYPSMGATPSRLFGYTTALHSPSMSVFGFCTVLA